MKFTEVEVGKTYWLCFPDIEPEEVIAVGKQNPEGMPERGGIFVERTINREHQSFIDPRVLRETLPTAEDADLAGLERRWTVIRIDQAESNPDSKHFGGCATFVLDISHDPFAQAAALAYAHACSYDYPQLAADLRALVRKHA